MVIFKPGDKVLIQGPPMGLPGVHGRIGVVVLTKSVPYRLWMVRVGGKILEFQPGELHRFPKRGR